MSVSSDSLSPPERLLQDYGVTLPEHIDLVGIANDRGAEVRYVPLGGCEARLLASDDQAIISINSNSSKGRQRFSLGHELAHWICDRKSGSFMCAKEVIGPQRAEARTTEAQANGYASQLILPTYLVDPWMQGQKYTLEVAGKLRLAFNSSLTAAAIKMAKRAGVPVCLVCHSQTRLVWQQRSPSFPDFFVYPELNSATDAFSLVFRGSSGMSRALRGPASTWMSGSGIHAVGLTSQSVRLPNGYVLTMLALDAK